MDLAGSPFWQMSMLVGAGCFLLWEAYRGWRAGVVRSGLNLAAMVLSTIIGYMAAQVVAMPFGGFEEIAGLIVGGVVGLGVALLVLVAIWVISTVLFKRTAQHESKLLRLLWGVGGAFFGVALGLLILWGMISLIRGLGTMAEAQNAQPPVGYPSHVEHKPTAIAGGLIKAKDSLELGPVGIFVKAVDPVPVEAYDLITDLGRLQSNRQAMLRFIEYPPIRKLFDHPRMAALLSDPSVIRGAEQGNPLALATNPKLREALEDPSFLKELQSIDWMAAMKFALENPSETPAPSPVQP